MEGADGLKQAEFAEAEWLCQGEDINGDVCQENACILPKAK